MAIQFYTGYSNIPSLQNYRTPEIPQVTEEQIREQDAKKQNTLPEITTSESNLGNTNLNDRRPSTALEDISLSFNKNETYDYIGSESEINTLDMQKAISDMQKDSVLQEYQYFVGNSQNLFASEDGLVIPKG